jgi:hypothetical protein
MNAKLNIDIDDIASSLANSDDNDQSKFLNTFFYALRLNCGSAYGFDMQLHAINRLLNDRSLESMRLITFEDNDV